MCFPRVIKKKNSFRASYIILWFLFYLTFSFIIEAQTSVKSDYWTTTDGLGRKTPTVKETGAKRDGKYVGMFYWTWHTDDIAEAGLYNISEILEKNPLAAYELNNSAWGGQLNGGVFWWDEPLFNYYRTTDEWVLRKHAQMLANAGVDVVFFDCTNGTYLWDSSYKTLLKTWQKAREEGVNTPKIAFLLNFSANTNTLVELNELYEDLYKPGLYKDLWFEWENKPLVLGFPEVLKRTSNAGLRFKADSSFTGIDAFCSSFGNNTGFLSFTLYKWDTDYIHTVTGKAIASQMFFNFKDSTRLALTFSKQNAGEYYWELNRSNEKVGVWKWKNTRDSVKSFFDESLVTDGNYDSRIYYSSGTSKNLTNDDGNGEIEIQISSSQDSKQAEIQNFFTFRRGMPSYVEKNNTTDKYWGWLQTYPQHGFVIKSTGGFEEATVGVAQNTNDTYAGAPCAFNQAGTYGRSYTHASGQNTDADAYLHGYNFQEQWSRAFTLDPDIVFVTGWNEWVAGRWDTSTWPNTDSPFSFVDEYNWEKSRDIEPVKAWGDYGDVYYIQLINNVRKFKGMEKQEPVSSSKTITIGSFDDWSDVKPEYLDYAGDTMWRNAKGQGSGLTYTNTTGRNDIVLSKVARDKDFIYFYVETAAALTSKTDPNWMRLWIDIDRDKSTGWQGYDYVINRTSPGDSLLVEKSVGNKWNWLTVSSVEYAISGNKLELKIPRSKINANGELDFEFKWSDNNVSDGNIMNFYVDGDAAPDGRFNYVYTESDTTTTSVLRNDKQLYGSYSLKQNYPNPFNPSTTISYTIAKPSLVKLQVYDTLGRNVATLVDMEQNSGSYSVNFNASRLTSGMYIYKLNTGNVTLAKKLLFIK